MPLFNFTNPYEMLLFIDDDLREDRGKLHDWQIGFMEDFASRDFTSQKPFKACVRAANGSGKDKYIIACCVVWFAMQYPSSVAVVTSSSGTQLDRQTNTYIEHLCASLNVKLGFELWRINYRHYTFCHDHEHPDNTKLDATIELFVTDEAGRAEGWHPKVNGGKFAIFVSEAKTIPDTIFTALSRCTGCTHRVDVSSPGLPMGHFFNICTGARNRKDIQQQEIDGDGWIQYHVTAYECSHITQAEIDQMKRDMPGGETGAAFCSAVLAEFGTTDEMTVLPYNHIWQAVRNHKIGHLPEAFNTAGVDLSAGGDETVLAIRNGNRLMKVIPFRFNNTQDTIEFLVEKFKSNGLDNYQSKIIADAGGLGKPIIDNLRKLGWSNIHYVLNQAKAQDQRVYLNRGAEMWFKFGKLLETGEIWLLEDDKTIRQLASRYYKITEGNKHKLESKLQARAAGRPSPDRADAVILCFSNYKTKLGEVDEVELPFEKPLPEELSEITAPFEMRKWAVEDDNPYSHERTHNHRNDISRIRRQLEVINQQRKEKVLT